ncbi:uncharacterized protein LOC124441183 [Xenia sp. Carnegie-2017]|uniref:uncharacterized protein LOC124441183 n=1 Tax=Xenia sp. Carnegie-2017 TaxID=2897299 RepID=UPI001F044491|nr:uncharacterized protein LOC124441183 [Xenia sp. Carnegie-2017]
MAVSVGNLVFIVIALVVISFQTFLFLNLGNQLNICLKRIEHLEELLKNATTTLRSKKHKLTSRKDILENEMNYELPADYSLKMTLLQSRHKIFKSKQRVKKSKIRGKRNSNHRRRYAVYTSWGSNICPAKSTILDKGQMVTTDGSDFFCLSDTPEDAPTRASSSRNRYPGNSVNLRGVTYGDIEGVLSLHAIPPSGIHSRNNKTVPCTICARYGKSSSAVVSAIERK